MKSLTLLACMVAFVLTSAGQVVSNVNWELEGSERIVITYDLARVENTIHFDVSVKVKIEDKIISAKALTGDVGTYIKVGTGKKIVWNMFEDISALNGELSVEVVAVNPVPTVSKTSSDESDVKVPLPGESPPKQKIPFWAGMSGIGVTGAALLTAGIKSAGEGQDLYKIYKENTVEASSVYTELGSPRDEVYSEANKKYKNGTLLQAAGAAIFLGAGVMIVNRMIQAKKVERRNLAVSPHLIVDPDHFASGRGINTGVTLTYRLR